MAPNDWTTVHECAYEPRGAFMDPAMRGGGTRRRGAGPCDRAGAAALRQRLGAVAREILRRPPHGSGRRNLHELGGARQYAGSCPAPSDPATPPTPRFPAYEHRRIKRVRVFIDNNPSPLVATFDFASTPVAEINMSVP